MGGFMGDYRTHFSNLTPLSCSTICFRPGSDFCYRLRSLIFTLVFESEHAVRIYECFQLLGVKLFQSPM